MASTDPERPLLAGVATLGGRQSDISAAANLLADSGAVLIDGQPLDETLAFGLAGGIGFLIGVFEYGDTATMTIVARNQSMPDPMIERLLDIAGVRHLVETTGGARSAARHLDAHLDAERSVLCTVGQGALGMPGLPDEEQCMSPVAVRVVGHDSDSVAFEFLGAEAWWVPRADFDRARSMPRAAKNRLVSIDAVSLDSPTDTDARAILRSAIAAGARQYDTPPAKPFASNIGSAGLRKWADLMAATKGPKRWSKVFAGGPRAAYALGRVHECLNSEYSAEAAGRPMFAAFLRRANTVLDEPVVAEAANAIDLCSERWATVSRLARDSHPAVSTFVDAGDRRRRAWLEPGDEADVAGTEDERHEALAKCDIDSDSAALVYGAMAEEVAAIAEIEADAVARLLDID